MRALAINFEARRTFNKFTLFVIAAIFLIVIITTQIGIQSYKAAVFQKKEFILNEKKNVEKLINYMQYGILGFRVLTIPSPLMAISYNNTTNDSLAIFIDSAVRLRIESIKQGKNYLSKPTGAYLDLSWLLLVIVGGSIMVWGYFTFREKEFFRFISYFKKAKTVFLGILGSRLMFLFVFNIALFLIIWLQYIANGIFLSQREVQILLIYFSILFLFYAFLLFLSTSIGTVKSLKKSIIILLFAWLSIFFLIPEYQNRMITLKTENSIESLEKNELDKLSIMNDFEREALKVTRRYPQDQRLPIERKFAEYHFTNILPKIEAVDNRLINQTVALSKEFQLLSVLNPCSFVKSVGNEMSSLGQKEYLRLYTSNRDKRRHFLRFIYDHRFYQNYSKVVPFIAPEKCIVQLRSNLPYYFGFGLLSLFLYIGVFAYLSLLRFKRILNPAIDAIQIEINLNVNQYNANYLNYILSQNEKMRHIIGHRLVAINRPHIIVPGINDFPGYISVKDIFNLCSAPIPEVLSEYRNRSFDELNADNKGKVILELIKLSTCDYIIFEKFYSGLSDPFLDYFSNQIEEIMPHRTVIYITSTIRDIIDKLPYKHFNPEPEKFVR